jgi:hypothetical protein
MLSVDETIVKVEWYTQKSIGNILDVGLSLLISIWASDFET